MESFTPANRVTIAVGSIHVLQITNSRVAAGLGAQGVIIKDVRYYTTKTMNGGTTFKCTMCEHSVTTLDFDHVNGNLRMQAAAVINKHAAFLHLPTWVRTKLGSRGAL